MIAFIINNEELDMFPDTVLEIEQNNVFLQLSESIKGNFSLPFSIPFSDKNARLLNFAFKPQSVISNAGIKCSCMRNGYQHSTGTLKIEQVSSDINFPSKGKINVYYLFGISDFYQGIKDLKLQNIDFGGERIFYRGSNSNHTGWIEVGWWQHVNFVMRGVFKTDYAIFPMANDNIQNEDRPSIPKVVNDVEYVSGTLQLKKNSTVTEENPIVLSPYLDKTLYAIGNTIGWTFAGEILSDPDFQKITLASAQAVGYTSNSHRGRITMFPEIRFNLANFLPNYTVSEFLIALKNRMGWDYDFDFKNKIIHIRSLNDAIQGEVVDLTDFCDPSILKKIKLDSKKHALRTQYSGELGNGAPELKNIFLQDPVNTKDDLPTPTDEMYANVRLVKEENNFYICRLKDDDEEVLEWAFYTYNIYDYVPADETEEINTTAGTLGNEFYSDYLDFIPRFNTTLNWPLRTNTISDWGIHLIFHHGVLNNKSGQPYPYASNHIYDSNGNKVAEWALTYEFETKSGTQVGLYHRNWKNILNILNGSEDVEFTLYLPYIKYLQLSLNTQIIIAGVKMFIKQIKETLPYRDSIKIVAARLS